MPLQILHTLTGSLIILCFVTKLIIHYYLDHSHGRAFGIVNCLLSPLPYFLPYKSIVADKYLFLKKSCNMLLKIAAVNLFLNLILGLLIYLA
jgi:hypothetical protein